MEKTARGIVVPVQMEWSDVGSWDAVWKLGTKDANGNCIEGDVVAIGTSASLVRNDGGPLIAAVGLENMAVIAVQDAVLIAPLSRISEVKEVVERLKGRERDYVMSPAKSVLPWGQSEKICERAGFAVKHLLIEPGGAVQMKDPAAKHWIVLRGTAQVEAAEKVTILTENQSIYIAGGSPCRVRNGGEVPLEIIEIESRGDTDGPTASIP